MALTVPKILLILLSIAGFWTLWAFPYQNGLLKILSQQNEPGAVIPGPTAAPMKQTYTGIGPVDKQLTILVSFFYTAIDGNRADVSLSFLYLGGQVLAAWVLVIIESLRVGNQGKFILTATTLFGVGVAIVGYACVAPLWFALHLWLSPTVNNPKDYQLIVNVPVKLAIAPISILLGFGLPSLLMCLPAPTMVSFGTKQTWTGIQQGWAIWIGLAQFLLTGVALSLDQRASTLTEADKRVKTIKYLRRAYAFAIMSSAGSHLAAWSLSLLAYAFPVLFSSTYLPQLQPTRIFVPQAPFGSHKVSTLADGALPFLQWDIVVGVTATLLWSLTLRVAAKHEQSSPLQILTVAIKLGIVAIALGPCAAAAVALWIRDELVFAKQRTS
ncbi:hypothetical protein LTR10_016999 [Elasticomyces elasticus]|uniref:Uncharacterized protein n=1 Tax=Exophiala sideris TaxID=1016849 RepID=A0ABR0JF19_9EURO|nr:hypothetical protein LTR10_016999 [Elasticomyces elasticus]KAK5025253.1 hypothetical protein LTS07_008104 [Exophiala sideris]KAK5029199.1 hypothetical protein LTR13_008736 [Exophiala sideris]KAK5063312.1 hypothetical protein LTR69_004018 [Exophiala sideris]KAK5179028.1 hypothetical protein LTR44_008517 [Eurotiomycetes sp. CCFEE 6388]